MLLQLQATLIKQLVGGQLAMQMGCVRPAPASVFQRAQWGLSMCIFGSCHNGCHAFPV